KAAWLSLGTSARAALPRAARSAGLSRSGAVRTVHASTDTARVAADGPPDLAVGRAADFAGPAADLAGCRAAGACRAPAAVRAAGRAAAWPAGGAGEVAAGCACASAGRLAGRGVRRPACPPWPPVRASGMVPPRSVLRSQGLYPGPGGVTRRE